MSHFINHLISSYGYIGVFILTIMEVACIPVSSELVLLGVGVLASTGRLSLVPAMIVALIGEMIGGYIAWGVGITGGRKIVEKYGKYVFIELKDLERVEKWFSKKGSWAVLIGRVLPFIRTFVALPAGIAEVSALRFGLLSLIGSVVWILAVTLIGYGVGSSLRSTINTILSNVGYLLGVIAVLAIVLVIVHKIRSRKANFTD
jgi:membrane protein DedA with SNARE-associated domain